VAVVQSAGQLATITKAESWWTPAPTSLSLYGGWQSYAAIWKAQPNVRTVVSFLARNIAQLGIKTYRRVSDTDREHAKDHPLEFTLNQPNPRTTRYRLMFALVSDMAIYENAFWLKIKGDGGRVIIVRIPPERVTPEGDNWLFADSFKVTGTRGEKVFAANEVVHFTAYNPDDPRWGCSPMETLRRILAEEASAGEYREQFWRNAARMEGVLSRPKEAAKLSDEAHKRLKADWQQLYAGAGKSAGGTAILEEGMEFKQVSFSARDSEYIASRKLTREEVAAAYHIPPPMVGVLDHATFSNITEQHKNLYQDTLGPWLAMIEQEIQLQLLSEFDEQESIYCEFNLAEKLKGSFEEQARSIQSLTGRPVLTADEARALLNRPAMGGDAAQLITPLNVLIGGQASPQDSAPPPKMVEEVLQKHFDRQQKMVLSRLGAGRDVKTLISLSRWNDELTRDLQQIGADTGHVEAINTQLANVVVNAFTQAGSKGVAEVFAKSQRGLAERLASLIAGGPNALAS
jgi:HK97 family phage portal protein